MPQLEPLKEFVCDECRKIIEKPENGYVEWYRDYSSDTNRMFAYRIVHHKSNSPIGSCYLDDNKNLERDISNSSMALDRCVGSRAVGKLLWLLKLNFKGYDEFKDKEAEEDYLELFRRLAIPYYEEGRFYIPYWSKIRGESKTPGRYHEKSMKDLIKNGEAMLPEYKLPEFAYKVDKEFE